MPEENHHLVKILAAFAAAQRETGISAALRRNIGDRIIDTLGNVIAGSATDISHITAQQVTGQGGAPQSVAIGIQGRYPRASAVLHNGSLAHCLDFDDTHLPSVVHPSSSIIPTVLAVAESVDAPIEQALAAAAVGLEITNRLGMAGYDAKLRNSVFFERGLHATSICGALGAAAAAALLLHCDADQIAHAMSIASSMGAGLLEANRTGGSVKRIHCGWAAHSGVIAAEWASLGLTGPATVLEGRFGFLQAHCVDRWDPTALTQGLGTDWTLDDVGFKPYPCNIYTHAGIDAALQLRKQGLKPADVESITIGVAAPTLRTIAEPAERKAKPTTGYEASFSGPYTFAAALCGGGGLGVYLPDFEDDVVADEARLFVASRVKMVEDPRCSAVFPNQIPSAVRVRTRDGRTQEIFIETNRGGKGRALSRDDLLEKFRLNAMQRLSPSAATDLLQALSAVENTTPRALMASIAEKFAHL